MRLKKRRNGKISIIVQVAVMLALCIILTGILTYFTQIDNSVRLVTRMTEEKAEMTAKEVSMAVMEYPSYPWLLNYWVEHAGEMNIDYDEDYIRGSWTQKKVRLQMPSDAALPISPPPWATTLCFPPLEPSWPPHYASDMPNFFCWQNLHTFPRSAWPTSFPQASAHCLYFILGHTMQLVES